MIFLPTSPMKAGGPSARPASTATYCLPSTAKVIGPAPMPLPRRFRRKHRDGDAAGPSRDEAAARIGRGAEPGPAVHRLGRHFWYHHRGLDASPGQAPVSCGRCGSLEGFLRRGARCADDRPGRAFPSDCRVLDPQEAFNTGAGDGNSAVMLLAFKSADHPGESWMQRALECCRDHGGIAEGNEGADAHREGAAGRWRNAFIRMPYGRERMVPRARCERPAGTSHLPFHPCRLIEQWQAIKQAASDQPSPTTTRLVAIIDLGTIASARSSSRQHSKRQNRHWIHAACSIPAYSSIPERGVRSDPLGIARFARRDAAAFKQFLQRYL